MIHENIKLTGLFTVTGMWKAPVEYPSGDVTRSYTGSYQWSENELNWVTFSILN